MQSAIPYTLVNIDYIVILSLCNTIGITGDSGSGKTTVSNIIKNMICNSFVLECDRYHKWERSDIKWTEYTHLNPESNLLMKMEDDIFNLKIGNDIYQVDYDHSSGKFTEKQRIESKDTIIVCGLHSLYMPTHIVKLKIYMDTDENLKIPWKMKRDVQNRGYSLEKILNQIETRKSDFMKYIYPQRDLADIIIRMYTNVSYESNDPSPPVFLNIGFANHFNLTSIIAHFHIYEIRKESKHAFLEFGQIYPSELERIIQFIIISV
jgi:uridine kinase